MRRTASWELVAEGDAHHQCANGVAYEPNIRTIMDVYISSMSKNVTRNFIENIIILKLIKRLKKWIKIIHCV